MTATPTTSAPGLAQRLDRGQHGTAGGGGVLHREDTAAADVGPLDAALHAVGLLRLAHHERVELAPLGGRGVQHGEGDRVRPEGQPAHGVVLPVPGEVEHDPADQGSGLRVEGDPAQVDVVVGLLAGGEGDPAVHDGLVLDLVEECVAVAHGRRL